MRYFTSAIINKLSNNKYDILSSSGRYHISKYQTPLDAAKKVFNNCLLYTSPSPRDRTRSRMPSSA